MKQTFDRLFQAFRFYIPEVMSVDPHILTRLAIQTVLRSLSPFVNILFPKWIIDELLGLRRVDILFMLAGAMIGLNFLLNTAKEAFKCAIESDGEKIRYHFHQKVVSKGMDLDFPSVEDPAVLDQMEKATTGLDYTGGFEGFSAQLLAMVSAFIVLIGVLVIVLLSAPWLLLVVLGSVLLSALFHAKIGAISRKYFLRLAEINRRFGYIFFELSDFKYGKDIRLFDASGFVSEKGEEHRKSMHSFWQNEAREKTLWVQPQVVFKGILDVVEYAYVGFMALTGAITIGTFTMLLSSTQALSSSLTTIVHRFVDLKIHSEMLQDTIKYLSISSAMDKGTMKIPIAKSYSFSFRRVGFAYPRGEKKVLDGIDLTIRSGERISIVGLNGEGKTTFVKLLTRLYDATEGEISLNGINIKNYDIDSYRSLFSVVFQDHRLFAFSIEENIWMDQEHEETASILERSGLVGLIDKLPHGLSTHVTKSFDEDGFVPSSGESQKIALARALAKRAPIIVLDEPTASLDPLAEAELYQRFDTLIRDKTAIYISHRLSSCLFADRIVLFHGGVLEEIGTHEELMAKNGRYHTMFVTQAMHYVEGSIDSRFGEAAPPDQPPVIK